MAKERPSRVEAIKKFFTIQIGSAIFLEKLGITPPGLPTISLPFIILLIGLVYMALSTTFSVSTNRLVMYLLFVLCSLIATFLAIPFAFVTPFHALTSVTMLLLLYSIFPVVWEVEWDVYRHCMNVYLTMMLLPGLMVLLQLLSQAILGAGHSLNLELLIPPFLLLPGYVYEAPIHYGATFVRPNGLFMLEPSSISLMLAISLIIEVMYFRRLWRMLFFAVALIGCLGGTGMVMMAVAAPFLLVRQDRKTVIKILAAGAVCLAIAVPLGVTDELIGRAGEFDAPTSSGFGREIIPAMRLMQLVNDPDFYVYGNGAGSLVESSWPVTKLGSEYGLIVTLVYVIMFLLFTGRCPNTALKYSFLFVFHFTGAYTVNPIALELLFLLCTSVVPVGDPDAPVAVATNARALAHSG